MIATDAMTAGCKLLISNNQLTSAIPRFFRGRIVSNALSLYAVQGLNYLLPLLMLPFLLRALSPVGYGSIMFAQSLMGYAGIVTEFGFNLTTTRDISVVRDDPVAIARIYWTTMAAKAVLFLVSAILVCAVILFTPAFRQNWPIFAASSLLVVGNLVFPQWYFQGLERLKEIALIQAISKCLTFGSAVIFVRSPQDAIIAALILSASQLFGVIAALVLGKPLAPAHFFRPTIANIKETFRNSWPMFAATVSTTLYLNTNTFMLGLMSSEKSVAMYSLANRLVFALQSLVGPVTQSIFPRASLLFAERREQAWKLLRRVSWLVLPAIAVASLMLGIFAPTVVNLMGGRAYAGVIPVVRIMAVVPLLVTIATILAQIVMVNVGLTRQLFRIYLLVGILNILLLPLLILKFDAGGAAASLVFAEALGPVLMLRTLRRHKHVLGW